MHYRYHKKCQLSRFQSEIMSVLIQTFHYVLKEILLETSFVEMKTILSHEKMPPNLVPLFPLSAKLDLIRLTPYNWLPCVSKFCDIRKVRLCKISCTRMAYSARNFAKSSFLDVSKFPIKPIWSSISTIQSNH